MKKGKMWTIEEINILKNNQNKTIFQLMELLNGRSYRSILSAIKRNGLLYKRVIRNKTKQKEYTINMSKCVHYKKKGIILDKDKGCNTYDIIEWYHFILDGKIKEFPKQVINEESTRKLFKYVIENILHINSRDTIKNITVDDFRKNKLWFKTFNLPDELYKVINFIYPEYELKPWEIKMTGTKVFKNEENILRAINWFLEKTNLNKEKVKNIHKYIDCEVEGLFAKYGLACLITRNYFNGYQNLFIWYFNKIGDNISFHDFEEKTNGYWKVKENVDHQMEEYLKYLHDSNFIINKKVDLPRYFSYGYLYQSDYKMLCVCIQKYKHYKNFYEWINLLHPEYNLSEKDFKVFVGCDNKTKCLSLEEKGVFDYIYKDLNITTITSWGYSKTNQYINLKYNEKYIPDFKIEKFNNCLLLDKPLIIEYYGLYNLQSKSKKVKSYIDKTHRKNEYYRSNSDIYFIDLYSTDLKNNFEGVRNKLTSFFMEKFNINLLDLKEAS